MIDDCCATDDECIAGVGHAGDHRYPTWFSEVWYESPGDVAYPQPDWKPLDLHPAPLDVRVTTAPHITLCSCFPRHPAATTSGLCPIHPWKPPQP